MSSEYFVKTRRARRAAPPVSRYSKEIFARLAGQTKFADPKLAENWGALVGADIARLCRPGRITGARRDCTLEVYANNAAAAAKVQFDAETIRRNVNGYLGPGAIARIAVLHRQNPRDRAPAAGAALSRFRRAGQAPKDVEK